MTRLVNREIETKVQVIDTNGDPVTGAVVSYKVLDEADVSFVTGAMTHVGDGIYSCTWEPDEEGEWTIECYSSNPKLKKSFTYHVETTPQAWWKNCWRKSGGYSMQTNNPTLEGYLTAIDISDGVTGVKLDYIWINQSNNESAAKNVAVEITLDGNVFGGILSIPASTSKWINLGWLISDFSAVVASDINALFNHAGSNNVKIRYAMWSANGTAQQLTCQVGYSTMEAFWY